MEIYKVSWEEVKVFSQALSLKLHDKKWKGIVCVTGGGLTPTYLLSKLLGISLILTFCIKSYRQGKQLEESTIYHVPEIENEGEGWLIVDALADSGRTFEIIRKYFPKACYAVLFAKPKSMGVVDFYVEEVPQEQWIELPWEQMVTGLKKGKA